MITIICDRWSSRIKLGAVKQQQQQSWMAGLVWRLNPRMSWSSAGEAPSTQMTRVCVCHTGNKLQAGRSTTERRVSLSAVRPTAPLPPLSLPPDLVDVLGMFVCLFVAKVAIVQRNMWKKTCGYRPLGRFLSQIWL
jgi:hypothetical protein